MEQMINYILKINPNENIIVTCNSLLINTGEYKCFSQEI